MRAVGFIVLWLAITALGVGALALLFWSGGFDFDHRGEGLFDFVFASLLVFGVSFPLTSAALAYFRGEL